MKIYIEIKNNGEIDIDAIHLMGVSTKRDDESKIGMFGSGNKYALAVLLNKGINFKIFSGEKELKVTTREVLFRGKLFNQIYINNRKTSLTTSMGKDWEDWFTIREIYCNAVDEGGEKISLSQEFKPEKNITKFYIELTSELKKMFSNIDRFILMNHKDKIVTEKTHYGEVTFYEPIENEFICYRKGIRIMPENTYNSLYRYDFSDIEINESRTYKYEHEVKERIASALAVTNDGVIIKNYLSSWEDSYEKNVNWEYVQDDMSDMWHQILFGRRVYPQSFAKISGDFEGKANSYIVPDELANLIAKNFDDIEVVGKRSKHLYKELKPTENEKNKIRIAKEKLSDIGYQINEKIVLCETPTTDVIAWYDKELNTIFHTRKHLNSIKELMNTLLEEHFHAEGHVDGQRAFVTFLIDELIKSKS